MPPFVYINNMYSYTRALGWSEKNYFRRTVTKPVAKVAIYLQSNRFKISSRSDAIFSLRKGIKGSENRYFLPKMRNDWKPCV